MGLTVKRDLTLDKLFEDFAIDPDKVETPKEELEKKQTAKEEKLTKAKK